MKIIREPKVYLLSSQVIMSDELQKFLDDHHISNWNTDTNIAGQKLVEIAGRSCYQSYAKPRPGGNKAYLDHILESQHGSVCEHAVWTFMFTGISRSCTHELVRHRLASYSQLSQRYVDESVAEYIEPDIIANDPELHEIWQKTINAMHAAYVDLSTKLLQRIETAKPPTNQEERTANKKQARQAARSILPNATETKITVTMNARSIRNFLEQRASKFAEPEIRKLANKVYRIMQQAAPGLFSDYTETQLEDGTFALTTNNRKV